VIIGFFGFVVVLEDRELALCVVVLGLFHRGFTGEFQKFVFISGRGWVVGNAAGEFGCIIIGGGGDLYAVSASGVSVFWVWFKLRVFREVSFEQRFEVAVHPFACIGSVVLLVMMRMRPLILVVSML